MPWVDASFWVWSLLNFCYWPLGLIEISFKLRVCVDAPYSIDVYRESPPHLKYSLDTGVDADGNHSDYNLVFSLNVFATTDRANKSATGHIFWTRCYCIDFGLLVATSCSVY